MDLTPYYQMVENCIKKIGVDPTVCRGQKEGTWDLKKGSASVWIDVFKRENDHFGYFQCMAPVHKYLPIKPKSFMKKYWKKIILCMELL